MRRRSPPLAGLLVANIRNLGYGAARSATRRPRPRPRDPRRTDHHRPIRPIRPATDKEIHDMAVLTQDQLLEAIDKMTVLELSEFIKRFEERYGVTAAAPVAAAAAPAAGGAAAARPPRLAEEQTEFTAILDRDRPEQDPGDQGRARADRPRPQGGQGPRRRVAEGRQGRRRPRRGREDQGRPRGAGRARSRSSSAREPSGVDLRGDSREPGRSAPRSPARRDRCRDRADRPSPGASRRRVRRLV